MACGVPSAPCTSVTRKFRATAATPGSMRIASLALICLVAMCFITSQYKMSPDVGQEALWVEIDDSEIDAAQGASQPEQTLGMCPNLDATNNALTIAGVGLFATSKAWVGDAAKGAVCRAVWMVVLITRAAVVDAQVIPHHSCVALVEGLPHPDCLLAFEKAGHLQLCDEMAAERDNICSKHSPLCKVRTREHVEVCQHSRASFQWQGSSLLLQTGAGFGAGGPYRTHSVSTSGKTCSSFGDTEPTESECKTAWMLKKASTYNAATWAGSTSYSFMPNGCVINTGLGVKQDGKVYLNTGAGAGPYKGRSLICVSSDRMESSNPPLAPTMFNTTNTTKGTRAFKCKPAYAVQSGARFVLGFPSWIDHDHFNYDKMRTDSTREICVNSVGAAARAWHATTDGYVPTSVLLGCSGKDLYGYGTLLTEVNTDCDQSNVKTTNTRANWMVYSLPVHMQGFQPPIPDGSSRIYCTSQVINFHSPNIYSGTSYISCEVHKETVCASSTQCATQKRCNCLQGCDKIMDGFSRWSGVQMLGATGQEFCGTMCVKLG